MLFVIPMFSYAQNRSSRVDIEKRMKEQNDALKKELKLDKKQTEKFDTAYKNYNKARTELMQQMRNSDDRGLMREKMTKQREAYDAELKQILTEKQFKKYQKIQEERQQQRGQRGMRGGDGRGMRGGF